MKTWPKSFIILIMCSFYLSFTLHAFTKKSLYITRLKRDLYVISRTQTVASYPLPETKVVSSLFDQRSIWK